jgi:uncharacterized protein (TIGR03067 family)
MKTHAWLLAAAACLVAADKPPDDAARKDLEKMQGDWQAARMVVDGYELPADDAQVLFRTVKGDHYTVFRYDKAAGKGTLKLDAAKKPRTVDARPDGPAGAKGPILGIYEFDGDALKLCFATPGKERPKDFEAKAGSGHTLTVWKREKK